MFMHRDAPAGSGVRSRCVIRRKPKLNSDVGNLRRTTTRGQAELITNFTSDECGVSSLEYCTAILRVADEQRRGMTRHL